MQYIYGSLGSRQILFPPPARGLACGYAQHSQRFHNTDFPTPYQADVCRHRIPRAHQSRVSGFCLCLQKGTRHTFGAGNVHRVLIFTYRGVIQDRHCTYIITLRSVRLTIVAMEKKLVLYTGLFEMIVGVLTTCHTQYT